MDATESIVVIGSVAVLATGGVVYGVRWWRAKHPAPAFQASQTLGVTPPAEPSFSDKLKLALSPQGFVKGNLATLSGALLGGAGGAVGGALGGLPGGPPGIIVGAGVGYELGAIGGAAKNGFKFFHSLR